MRGCFPQILRLREAGRYAGGMSAGLSDADQAVSPLVRKAAAWSWRLLAIFGAVFALLWVVMRLEVIVVPVALATMVAALLIPCLLYTSPSPRDGLLSRMPSSA